MDKGRDKACLVSTRAPNARSLTTSRVGGVQAWMCNVGPGPPAEVFHVGMAGFARRSVVQAGPGGGTNW